MTARFARLVVFALLAPVALVGCKKGPAEQAGERIDNTVDEATKGHTEPFDKGAAQKAGESIDKATGNDH